MALWRPDFVALLVLSVPVSTMLGLLPAAVILEGYWEAFKFTWDVGWSANVVFVLGTVAATALVILGVRRHCLDPSGRRVDRRRVAGAVLISMGAHLVVYQIAWTLLFGPGNSVSGVFEYIRVLPQTLYIVVVMGFPGWIVWGGGVALYAAWTLRSDMSSDASGIGEDGKVFEP